MANDDRNLARRTTRPWNLGRVASMRCLALLGMASALIAAGCGGGNGESAPSEETSVEELVGELLTETTTPDTGTSTDASDDFCWTLLTARVFISGAFLDPGSVSQDGLGELADAAPEEIRADIETLAQALATLAEKVGDDPDVFELEAALQSLSPRTEAADEHVDAWANENCTRQG